MRSARFWVGMALRVLASLAVLVATVWVGRFLTHRAFEASREPIGPMSGPPVTQGVRVPRAAPPPVRRPTEHGWTSQPWHADGLVPRAAGPPVRPTQRRGRDAAPGPQRTTRPADAASAIRRMLPAEPAEAPDVPVFPGARRMYGADSPGGGLAVYAIDDTIERVAAFYAAEFRRRGWRPGGLPPGDEPAVRRLLRFHRHGEEAIVLVRSEPARGGRPAGVTVVVNRINETDPE